MPDYERAVQDILCAESLHDCGARFEDFLENVMELPSQEEQKDVFNAFREQVRACSSMDWFDGSLENRGWDICPPEQMIATHLDVELVMNGEDFEAHLLHAQWLQDELSPAFSSRGPKPALFNKVMTYLDSRYQYSDRVLFQQRTMILFPPDILDGADAYISFIYHEGVFHTLCPHFIFFKNCTAVTFVQELAQALVYGAFLHDDAMENVQIPFQVLEGLELLEPSPGGFQDIEGEERLEALSVIVGNALLLGSPFAPAALARQAWKDPERCRLEQRLFRQVLRCMPVRPWKHGGQKSSPRRSSPPRGGQGPRGQN